MNYEEKYKKALEIANAKIETYYHLGNTSVAKSIEEIFPELKESEDESIRKEIIQSVRDNMCVIHKDKCIAWLEKQGEQKSTDKVELKFKKGDWIVYCNEDVDLITGIEDNGYLINKGGYIPFTCQGDMRLWTIQDAKDGDVLLFEGNYNSIVLFQGIGINGKGRINYHCKCDLGNYSFGVQGDVACLGTIEKDAEHYHPATKEQCDLLFQKMKKAGYEWDSEKKELKKIEQKSTWSEKYIADVFEKVGLARIVREQENDQLTNAVQSAMIELSKQKKTAWSEEDEPQKELAETYLAVFDEKFPILPTLKGKQLADYKNFLNKCQQILGLKYWSFRPLQAKLFEKLSLLWAAWGAEHLKGLGQTNGDTDNEKQEWSEEDEEKIELLIAIFEVNHPNDYFKANPINTPNMKAVSTEEIVDWLKSLKERVPPQINQEWSKEEKKRIDRIINVLDWAEEKGYIRYNDWEDYVCYVKSLRPQN